MNNPNDSTRKPTSELPGALPSASGSGSDAASKRAELLAAFDAMHEESIEDYKDYVRRCGGVPISKVKP